MTSDYQEIELTHYLNVLITRWKTLLTTALVVIILVLVSSTTFLKPLPLYKAQSIIRIGLVDENLIESRAQTKVLLLTEGTAFHVLTQASEEDQASITQKDLNAFLETIEIDGETETTALPENYLGIMYEDTNAIRTQKIVEAVQDIVLEIHQKKFDEQILIRDQLIEQKEKELASITTQLTETEERLNDLSALRYPSSYAEAQGRAYPEFITTLNGLRAEKIALEQEILSAKLAERLDVMSTVISPPRFPDTPFKEQRMAVLLVITITLGFFIGILLTFVHEWWDKNISKLKVQNKEL